MTRPFDSSLANRISSPRFILRLVSLVGGFGLLSGGWGWAQSESTPTVIMPPSTEAADLALPAIDSAPVPPTHTAQSIEPEQVVESAPAPEVAAPTPPVSEPEIPSIEPMPSIVFEAPAVPDEVPAGADVPAGYNDIFIDPTEYSVGETVNPDAPDVVFAERSTGCQVTLSEGESLVGNGCVAAVEGALPEAAIATGGGTSGGGVNIGPVNISANGVSVGGTTVASREYYNRMLRPLNNLRQTAEAFIFPLATPSPITSLFGWRTHPIFGTTRFHSGTDLGAPLGTPILAAHDGQVVVSDYMGGYGFTVILRQRNGQQETLYGHMSRLLVQAGEWVEQGEVIGLVGSTGNSTGPHLHFEVRQLTGDGWIAVNPNELLQYTLNNFAAVLENPLAFMSPETEAEDAESIDFDVPFRPAQPNAS